ncbi:MAG: serine hydrolase [Bacillota bacterium]|nr:serine hydrolase [Bacillota bacterium]
MNERLQFLKPDERRLSSETRGRIVGQLEEAKINLHGLLIARGWDVELELYWAPFDEHSIHRMYSTSKSITATAIGCLLGEGRLALEDPIVKYYPELVPADVHPLIAEMTLRDLLIMATGRSTTGYQPDWPEWRSAFFTAEPESIPGTIFRYDTSGSNMLSDLVERVSGQSFLDYLRGRLLDRLGFSAEADIIRGPGGIPFGGSGVLCTLRDMARIAILWNRGGVLDGEAVLPPDFVAAARSVQIREAEQAFGNRLHMIGYGYQIWILKDGFMFSGMGAQNAYCFPEHDLVVCTIGDTQTNAQASAYIHQTLRTWLFDVPGTANGVSPVTTAAALPLRRPGLLPEGESESPWLDRVAGRVYRLERPIGSITAVRVDPEEDGIGLSYERDGVWRTLHAGMSRARRGPFPEASYHGMVIGRPDGVPYDCLMHAAWIEPHKLRVLVASIGIHLGSQTWTLSFKDERVSVDLRKTAEYFFDDFEGLGWGRAE